ncbi:ATP-binding protein [Ketobacter sp.]|uniref:ATP-binding protein n=1 Tax=Ketobacter sp. TaxID=2083498 RepID=UPI000F21506E|nr:ATP-binding protein [Ketobacter sp.]RLT94775.1 MAG: hypothetical protein D9N14_15910 [Ketobacter sp.]
MNARFLALLAVPLFLISSLGFANCDALEPQLTRQERQLSQLEQQREALDELLQGQIKDSFVLADVVDVSLDVTLEVLRAERSLRQKLGQAQQVTQSAPEGFESCPQLAQRWEGQARQIRGLEQVINQHLLHLYQLPRNSRLALVREITQWQNLYQLESQVQEWAKSQPQDEAIQTLNQAIRDWISYWRSSTRIWLAQLVSTQARAVTSNEVWSNTLKVPHPQSGIDWGITVDTAQQSALLDWLEILEEAHRALVRESGKWRNQHIWSQGWINFFREMSHPGRFWQQLVTEIHSAPTNLVDAITRPFIRDYRRAVKQDKRGETLSSWFLQALALLAIMSALLKLAAMAPQLLSQAQQRLLSSLQHRGLIQFNAAVLWFIKPNAPWFVVFVGANVIAEFLPDNWIILNWLAPVGTLYATFRAVRVIMEWLIARTFTRSGQFVSSHTASQQTQDAQRVSWLVLLGILAWILVKGTGGGYLMFFVIILIGLLLWLTLLWLMLRYREPVARFLLYAAGKGTSKKLDPKTAQRWWMMPAWPLLLVAAHIADIVVHLHQKLLIFDTYRSVSVKMIRIRLAAEAKEDEQEDEDEALPDASYSDWMRCNNKAWVEAYDINTVLQPIQNWNKEKTDDNVLLIVGDQGSGKTALINRLSSAWKDTPISVLNIPAKTTDPDTVLPLIAQHLCIPELDNVAELVKLDAELEPQIVVLDNTHNLFLSEVGCLDAYRALNQCLNAHLQNIFWVVVMHAPSWTYLSCVFNRELRFSQVFKMPKWSPSDIRKLILSRHQGSRRRIRYDELLLSASAGSESSSVRAANSRVFNILWEQSGGIPQVAIHLWLDAARTKDKVVDLGVPTKPNSNALKPLKDDLCFVFAAIVIHKSLSSEELILVTHFPDAIVRHALKQGLNLGLLWRDDNKRYRIQPSWQGTLSAFLASKNLLWDI